MWFCCLFVCLFLILGWCTINLVRNVSTEGKGSVILNWVYYESCRVMQSKLLDYEVQKWFVNVCNEYKSVSSFALDFLSSAKYIWVALLETVGDKGKRVIPENKCELSHLNMSWFRQITSCYVESTLNECSLTSLHISCICPKRKMKSVLGMEMTCILWKTKMFFLHRLVQRICLKKPQC